MSIEKYKKQYLLKGIIILGIILIIQIFYYINYNVLATVNTVTNNNTSIQTTIAKKDVKKLKIVMPEEPYTYTGKQRNASVKIYNGNQKLTESKDYALQYKNNINTGKASVTITGKGNYTGSITKTYYIVPSKAKIKSVLFNAKSTKATITWKRDKQASGYAIYMSKSKDGKYEKIKTIKNNKTTTYVKKNLKSSKTYYFKVRAFIEVDGKRIYSKKYSDAKTNTGLLAKVTLNSPMSGTNRNHNLKLASKKINGKVLKPGDTFNWFKVVGSASKSKGYRKAGIFINGKTVQGYGGGVCQVSSTLYQASKKAKLKIVERHTHSKNVTYTKVGEDATVAYGSKNLRIKNNKKYSIKIVEYTKKTKTICELYRVTD